VHPGQFIAHFINTAIVTAIVAAVVLWRYKVGVLAGMNTGGALELPVPPLARRLPASADTFGANPLAWERQARRRVAAGVAALVLVCSLPLAYLAAVAAGAGTTPMHVLGQTGQFLLAAVPMAALLASYSWRGALGYAGVLLAAGGALMLITSVLQRLATGRAPSPDQVLNVVVFLQLTGVNAAAALLVMLVTAAPRVRGVAPMTFVGLLVFSLAPLGGSQLTRALAMTRTGSELVLYAGLTIGFVLLALPAGWVAWRCLVWAARAFETKRVADSEVLVNVWWVMFVSAFWIEHINTEGWSWPPLLIAVAACVAFAVSYRLLLRRILPGPRPPRRTLLLLRVFADIARTERLFDRVASRWRYLGPVTMIAAPDVAARTVDPSDFLEFATGRLHARFVRSAADLDERLAGLDGEPDPDGRYRVNELCCQADTWRAAVVSLMDRADAVLMDLRDFSAKRAGCAFELQQLGQRIEPGRLVLAVDDSTDREFLAANLGTAAFPRLVDLGSRRVSDRALEQVFDEVVSAAYAADPAPHPAMTAGR
jgi:hypothetical protein